MADAPDEETAEWLRRLDPSSPLQAETLTRLHALLLRAARAEVARRQARYPISGPELDDLAHQAAHDAMLAVVAKLDEFRQESRFTTWAYKFVILEVSSKLARHTSRRPTVEIAGDHWDRLPDRFGVAPADHAAAADLIAVVRKAVSEELTDHQRDVFVALVVDDVPLDVRPRAFAGVL